jgi:hypothetical protein
MLRRFGLAAFTAIIVAGTAAAQAPNPSFNIVNRGSSPINQAFATPAGMTTWGRDRIANHPIPPGQTAPVRLPADGSCLYDIRVVYANGQSDERRNLNTCNLDNVIFPSPEGRSRTTPEGRSRTTPEGRNGATSEERNPATSGGRNAPSPGRQQAADDPTFQLVNRGRSAINEFYASLENEDNWGGDRLGEDTVAPGSARVVHLPAGACIYDVRIVYANGEAAEKRHVNLCSITDMRVP